MMGGGNRERVGGQSSNAAVLYGLPPHASHQWHSGVCHVGQNMRRGRLFCPPEFVNHKSSSVSFSRVGGVQALEAAQRRCDDMNDVEPEGSRSL